MSEVDSQLFGGLGVALLPPEDKTMLIKGCHLSVNSNMQP